MTVLVLSEDLDPTVDAVVDELRGRGVEVFRCDTAWFPERLTLAAGLESRDHWAGELRTAQRRLPLGEIRSVWYRRPTAFVFDERLSGPERRHAAWEAKLGFGGGGVLADLNTLWVNHPSREADASYKPRQLATAKRCGLTVPPTLVTNEPGSVRRFAERHGRIVVKPLAYGSIVEDGGAHALYTHALAPRELTDLAGVDATAHLFQRAIVDKAFEVRLTVVGRSIFAAAIHADSEAARADWRSDYDALRLSVVDVPPPVASGVLAFMESLGLMFGAFDFAVDTAGTWWFFECNSAGQFGFVEDATGLPITAALADLLSKGSV